MRLVQLRLLATTILVVVSFFCVSIVTREARAQGARPGAPLHVLGLETEDADEQAEALSIAIRSRARDRLAWPVASSSPSLSMFLAALRCPSRPDPPCLQRISEQLKTDRFIYGHVGRVGKGRLSASIHLYARGQLDVAVQEVFSDNLKDQNDDYLRRMAARIVDRLTASSGPQDVTITVRAGDGGGVVWVDGSAKGRLQQGRAIVRVAEGRHVFEVRSPETDAVLAHQEVTVTAGADSTVTLPLTVGTENLAASRGEAGGGGNTRSIVGWGLIGLGALAGGFGIYEGVHFLSLKSDTDDFRQSHGTPSREAICQAGRGENAGWNTSGPEAAKGICDNYDAAKTASLLGFISGSVAVVSLGVGTYLLLTDTSAKKETRDDRTSKETGHAARSSVQILPYLGARASGLDVRVVF